MTLEPRTTTVATCPLLSAQDRERLERLDVKDELPDGLTLAEIARRAAESVEKDGRKD